MPASFHCNECGFQTQVKDEFAGRKIKCPKCKAVGAVAGAAEAKPKPVKAAKPAEDSRVDLLSVNLDSFQDVEVPEGEVLDENAVEKKPKAKKKKKSTKGVDPQVKTLAFVFSLLSIGVIAGIVVLGGPTIVEEFNAFMTPAASAPAGGDAAAPVQGG
ncbi:hypothetical protein SH668x_002887 [Planctomicrobium sp. SH668]|uniref:hypothetical protein n=1 Tax=Planctomicrobium sp. SH668 TaxID=3448126 RepID=UPI003F5BE292